MLTLVTLIAAIAVISGQTVPCGVPVFPPSLIGKRTIGGSAATPGSWSWLVWIIGIDSYGEGYGSGVGSILGPRAVMTSARLFKGDGYDYLAQTDISKWSLVTDWRAFNISPKIKSITIHENYNTTTFANDIALIISDKDIVYKDDTRPICLPSESHPYHVGDTC